jgi:hypothetical protein
MWVLVFVFLQTGGGFTIPGYSSLERCVASGNEILKNDLHPSKMQGAQLIAFCKRVD